MPWIVRWELEPSMPLAPEQRELAAQIASGTLITDDGRAASGSAEMPYAREDPRWPALLAALTALRAAFPDARCEVADDMGLVGWNAATACYDRSPGSQREPAPPAPPAEAPAATLAALFDPPPSLAALFDPPPALAAPPPAPPPPGSSDPEAEIRALLAQIASSRDSYDLRRRLERTYDPVLVARLAIAVLPSVEDRMDLASVVRQALGQIDDLEPLRDALLALWHLRPPGGRWLHDVGNALESAASHPIVLAPAIRALEDSPASEGEKLEVAARLLGKARAAAGDAVPVLAARARRDRGLLLRDAAWRGDLILALRDLGHRDAFGTLLLELGCEEPPGWPRLVAAMVRSDPDRAIAIAPRLLHLPGVAIELADELGDVRSEAATALLRRLTEHPLARVRGRAARRLALRGDAEFPRVAAVWATLDAGAAPDDIDRHDRDDFLVALGLDKGTAEVDWSARIAALGMSPVALAALPAPIDNLTDADSDVRSRALRAIDEAPRREYLLATALAAEVQDELHRRWPQIDDYHGWYRWREASGMPGWLRSARDDVPRVVRSHASELSDQRLTPALRDILARGAEWFAATLPAPTIELGDDERAAADAEERAVIARRGAGPAASLDADPVLPAVDDLFAEPPPDAQGPVLGTRDEAAAERIAPDQAGAIAPAGAVAGSELIAIRDGKVRLLRYRLDDREVVDFVALLESRVRHLRVDAIELVVRDAAGAAVDHQRRIYERHLRPAAWIDHQWRVDDEVMARAHAVELRGTWREAFRARVAHAAWPAFAPPRSLAVRQPVPLAVTRDPGAPAVGAAMTLTVRADDHVDLRFLIELTSQRRTAAATPIELAVAVRNKHGSVLDRRAVSVTLPADGTGALVEVDLRIAVNQLSRAHLIDVAVQGARTVVETIASYPLNGAT